MLGQKIISQIGLRFISMGLGFVSIIFIARALAPEEIGQVVFIIGICTLPLLFSDLGFNDTANTKIAQEKFTPESNLATLLYIKAVLFSISLLGSGVVFFLNRSRIDEIGIGIFFAIVLALHLDALGSALQTYFVGRRHFYKFMMNNFIANTASSVFLIGVALFAPSVALYAMATLVKSVVLVGNLLFLFRKITIDWTVRKEIFKDFFTYAKPLFILFPLYFVIGNAESILLPYLISGAALGIFSIGLKLYNIVEMVKKSFTSYVYTYVCNIIAKVEQTLLLEKLGDLVTLTQVFGTVLVVGLINRAEPMTVLFFGEQYRASAIVTQLMCLYLYFDLVFSTYGHIIYAKAAQKKLISWTIIGGVVLLVSSIILIPQRFMGMNFFGLDYAGMPLAKLARLLFPGVIIAVMLSQRLIGTAFLKKQTALFAVFILYWLADLLLLQVSQGSLVWVFVSWILLAALYLGLVMRFLFNDQLRTEVKQLFSITRFKEGLHEV